jgi:PRTRC genetic system protein E
MTMFEELYALAAEAALAMTIGADEKTGRMTINVMPTPKDGAVDTALRKALSLSATPAEFDEGFVAALRGYREARESLAEQWAATREVLEAAKAAAAQQAGAAVASVAKSTTSAAARAKPAPDATAAAMAAGDEPDLFG